MCKGKNRRDEEKILARSSLDIIGAGAKKCCEVVSYLDTVRM